MIFGYSKALENGIDEGIIRNFGGSAPGPFNHESRKVIRRNDNKTCVANLLNGLLSTHYHWSNFKMYK